MGTYDTRGGAPISPRIDDPVTELQEKVGMLLEDAGIPDAFCDQIMKILEEAERDAICGAQERRLSGP